MTRDCIFAADAEPEIALSSQGPDKEADVADRGSARIAPAAAVAAAALAVSACGGGGSGSGGSPSAGGGTPTAQVRRPQSDDEAARFLLQASFSASTGAIAAVRSEGFEP
ncbi:MAG: hypothetical protein V2I74_09075 [Erythrobacter sp.]|jgi:hypothetical protein|nr:hypothetical protein [Erythrobacter sp.]